VNFKRSSGILLHPTSLPSGRLDRNAYRFVDWLASAGQRWWQVLPLGPPGDFDSPYASPSAFAGSAALLARPSARVSRTETAAFRERHAYWIEDWLDYGGSLEDQVRFEREWRELRRYAASRGIRIIGDMPIYVAPGSADHLAHPRLFRAGEVSGVPPDLFTRNGQLWGNPTYDWAALRDDGYRWWIERFRRSFELVDFTRLDHFRGFVAYWAVPSRHSTARLGRWRRGPGAALFHAAEAALSRLPFVAEDLGVITPAVNRLREELGLPGMVVLQFGLGAVDASIHRPANHPVHAVAYTGTHDNPTALGWWEALGEEGRARTGLDAADPAWSLIRVTWSSRAVLALTPLQDVLRLGDEARMNTPGTVEGNWRWRFGAGALTAGLAEALRLETRRARR
jgi:4-alpha-glucanotransferase